MLCCFPGHRVLEQSLVSRLVLDAKCCITRSVILTTVPVTPCCTCSCMSSVNQLQAALHVCSGATYLVLSSYRHVMFRSPSAQSTATAALRTWYTECSWPPSLNIAITAAVAMPGVPSRRHLLRLKNLASRALLNLLTCALAARLGLLASPTWTPSISGWPKSTVTADCQNF